MFDTPGAARTDQPRILGIKKVLIVVDQCASHRVSMMPEQALSDCTATAACVYSSRSFILRIYGNNAMQAEIHAVRANFLDWSAQQESWEIRMWCNIIARHLELLTREPHNLALRQQTAAKVEQLRIVAARVVKLKKLRK